MNCRSFEFFQICFCWRPTVLVVGFWLSSLTLLSLLLEATVLLKFPEVTNWEKTWRKPEVSGQNIVNIMTKMKTIARDVNNITLFRNVDINQCMWIFKISFSQNNFVLMEFQVEILITISTLQSIYDFQFIPIISLWFSIFYYKYTYLIKSFMQLSKFLIYAKIIRLKM